MRLEERGTVMGCSRNHVAVGMAGFYTPTGRERVGFIITFCLRKWLLRIQGKVFPRIICEIKPNFVLVVPKSPIQMPVMIVLD